MKPCQPLCRIPFAAVALLVLLPLAPLHAQGRTWIGWTAYWENDSFQPPGIGSDENYTNGVRVSVVRDPLENWAWVDSLGRHWRGTSFVRDAHSEINDVPVVSLVLGQNFFTPSVITDVEVDPRDRPYAGLLYGGLRLDFTEEPQELGWAGSLALQHSMEGYVGVFGPPAFAKEVQTGVHVLRGSRIPKGWDHQLGFDPLLQVGYSVRGRLGGSHLDVTPHGGVLLGNPQTLVYGGATARLGVNLSGFPALLNPMAVDETEEDERPDFEVALLAGVEGRAFAHNAAIEGGLFGEDPLGAESDALVGDLRLGGSVRLTDWRLTYTWVRRTPELAGGPFADEAHDYGSLALAYQPYGRDPVERSGSFLGCLMGVVFGTVFENVLFEAGLGPGSSEVVDDGRQDGIGMHVAVAKGILDNRVFLGGEMTGIGREGPVPLPGADHTDEFLRTKLFTVRARPFGAPTGPGIFHVRAGVGTGSHRLQVVAPLDGRVTTCPPGTVREDDGKRCHESDTGTAVMVGGGWAFALGSKFSTGLDLSWNRISSDGGPETFFVPAFTMRYHPGG